MAKSIASASASVLVREWEVELLQEPLLEEVESLRATAERWAEQARIHTLREEARWFDSESYWLSWEAERLAREVYLLG